MGRRRFLELDFLIVDMRQQLAEVAHVDQCTTERQLPKCSFSGLPGLSMSWPVWRGIFIRLPIGVPPR
jgi:hypothetical protein